MPVYFIYRYLTDKYFDIIWGCVAWNESTIQKEHVDEETTFLGGVNSEPADMSEPMINVKLNGVSIQFIDSIYSSNLE